MACECKEVRHPSGPASYPWTPVLFLLLVTIGQGYVSAGLQAVLEFFFVHYLFICSGSEQATSLGTTSVNVYIAIYQLCAISAGFLADKLIGNYLTQVLSVFLTTGGVFLLGFSTWQFGLSEPGCCYSTPNGNSQVVGGNLGERHNWSSNCSELHREVLLGSVDLHMSPDVTMALALLGLVLYAVGYGHINTVQSVFVADQFKEESESKRRSFSWYYLCCNLGALGGESGLPVLRQTLGFVVAWLTLLGSTSVSTLLFLTGSCYYVKKKPTQRLKCSDCCCCHDPTSGSLNTESERVSLLDTASPVCSVLSLLKQLLPYVGVFGPLVVFWAVFYQQNTTWVVQGSHMDCYVGKLHIPPDLMPSVNDFLVVVIIPVLEYLVYPHLEHTIKTKIQPLHKVIAGMVCAALSFLLSGLLEVYVIRYPHDDCRGDVSIAWQLPQLFFISIAEAIVCVTGLEFAYSQAPLAYRNIVTAMWYLSQALGTLLNAGVALIPHMDLLQQFFVYMTLMVLVTVVFTVINRHFTYKTT